MGRRKAVFFDVGYTLVDEDEAQRVRVQRVIEAERARGRTWREEEIFAAMERACMRRASQFYGALEELGIPGRYPFPRECERLYPWAKPLLERCKAKGVKLGLITNQPYGWSARLAEFGLEGIFDVVAVSGDLGVEKPAPAIFRYALEKGGVRGAESVMVGDRLDNDLLPAKALGMYTIWLKQGLGRFDLPTPGKEPDATIARGEELEEVLKEALDG